MFIALIGVRSRNDSYTNSGVGQQATADEPINQLVILPSSLLSSYGDCSH